MKINEKNNKKLLLWNKINLALSILLLAIALFGLLRKPFDMGITISSFILGSTLLVGAYIEHNRITAELEGKTIADERSRRAIEKAGFLAFLLLIAVLIISGLANSILNLRLEYTMTINVILFAGVFSWLIIVYYLDKKSGI